MPICVSCALGESHSPCPLFVPQSTDVLASTPEAFEKLTQQRLADDLTNQVYPPVHGFADAPWDGALPGDTITGYEYHINCIGCHNLLHIDNLADHFCADKETVHDFTERLVDPVSEQIFKCSKCDDWMAKPYENLHKCALRMCTKCGLLVLLGEHNCWRDNL